MTISNDDNIDASTLDLKELTMLRTPMGKSDGLMPTQVQERIMKMPGRKKTKVRSTCSERVILIVEYLIMKSTTGLRFMAIQFFMRSATTLEREGVGNL